MGADEISGNTSGRVATKGMGTGHHAERQDAGRRDAKPASRRWHRYRAEHQIVTIDIETGDTKEYAYHLDSVKTAVSEILAINNHEFPARQRDNRASRIRPPRSRSSRSSGNHARGAAGEQDQREMTTWLPRPLPGCSSISSPVLNQNGIASFDIPAKLEGIAFWSDVIVAAPRSTPCMCRTTTTTPPSSPT